MDGKLNSSFTADFECRVRQMLVRAKPLLFGSVCDGLPLHDFSSSNVSVGVAVSGGADSVSLLISLLHIFGSEKLHVITVNHNLRPENETSGDAEYVESLCGSNKINCTTVTLERGKITEAARVNGWSLEESARVFRYNAFDSFIKINNLDFLCLAHNQGDNLETILMRFLQGSGSEGGSGISLVRGKFVRPLLLIPRVDIERYLTEQNITWRTDATNSDTKYLRNRIRNILVPELENIVPGWKTAVLSGAEKASEDNKALYSIADEIAWSRSPEDDSCLCLDSDLFYKQSCAVQRRLLFKAFASCGADRRVPYSVVKTVMSWNCSLKKERKTVSAAGICISILKNIIFVKKMCFTATESGFIDILKEDRICMRSVQSGDMIRTKDGSMRSVSGIFSAWHVEPENRNRIKLVQNLDSIGQPLVAVLGSGFGGNDWVLKEYSGPSGCLKKE